MFSWHPAKIYLPHVWVKEERGTNYLSFSASLALCLASAMKVLKQTLITLFFVVCLPLILVLSFAAAGWDKLRRRR
jgi:Kef-type K+ transport system membrane component KefB